MNAKRIGTTYKDLFKAYPVIGLSKVKTMETRKKSYRGAGSIPPGFENKVPIWKKTLDDEHSFITKDVR